MSEQVITSFQDSVISALDLIQTKLCSCQKIYSIEASKFTHLRLKLAHLPIDGLLQNILGGEFKQALQLNPCICRAKNHRNQVDLPEKIISGANSKSLFLQSSKFSKS